MINFDETVNYRQLPKKPKSSGEVIYFCILHTYMLMSFLNKKSKYLVEGVKQFTEPN